MYKTFIPHVHVAKKVQWKGTKMCAIFGGTRMFSLARGKFKVGRAVYHEEGKCPEDWTLLVLM